MTLARRIDPASAVESAEMRKLLEAPRHSSRGGGAIWCGGLLPGGGASSNLLGHGAADLLPMALIGLLLAAATIWMVRRWGARPPVLPPGVKPPPAPAPEPSADAIPARPPAPARSPAPGMPLTS